MSNDQANQPTPSVQVVNPSNTSGPAPSGTVTITPPVVTPPTETPPTETPPVETPSVESIVEDTEADIDTKLNLLYSKLQEGRTVPTDIPVSVPTVPPLGADTTQRVVRNVEDYQKWKEEDPVEAERWFIQQVAQSTVEAENMKRRRQEDSVKWLQNERAVIARHHASINRDGTVNQTDPWMQAYLQVGRENPILLSIPNGPVLAEAMANELLRNKNGGKELEAARKAGAEAEAQRLAAVNASTTGVSTVNRPSATPIVMSEAEKAMAAKYRMTPEQWQKYKTTKHMGV